LNRQVDYIKQTNHLHNLQSNNVALYNGMIVSNIATSSV